MITLGVGLTENEYYAPYTEDCWINLAKAIMKVYADKYSYQIPTSAYTQAEYSELDRSTYLPIRKSVLKQLSTGPLRNSATVAYMYQGLERRRLEYKESLGIKWKENIYEEFRNL